MKPLSAVAGVPPRHFSTITALCIHQRASQKQSRYDATMVSKQAKRMAAHGEEVDRRDAVHSDGSVVARRPRSSRGYNQDTYNKIKLSLFVAIH
jgi:hypothetical protein